MLTEYAQLSSLLGMPIYLFLMIMFWTLAWTGVALWKAAKKNSIVWFIVLFLVNTMGLLEILYIFFFSKLKKKEIKPKKKQLKKKET